MNCIINKNKEFCGFIESKNIGVNKSITPLWTTEKAVFENDNWSYSYNELKYDKVNKYTCYDLVKLYINDIFIPNGTYSKPKEKEISILIPCYGKARFIIETVESCINQTLLPHKVIILLMDKDSIALKDELEKMSENIECVITEQMNVVLARRKLVELCPTEYFVFLDGDDTLSNNALEEMYNYPSSIVFINMNRKNNTFIPVYSPFLSQNLTGLLCKEVFNELGLDESLSKGGEDFDFTFRLASLEKWNIGFTKKAYYFYKENHDENSLTKSGDFEKSIYKVIKKNKGTIKKYLSDKKLIDFTEKDFFQSYEELVDNINNSDLFFNDKKIYNKFIKLLSQSRKKTTSHIFNPEEYSIPSDFHDFNYINYRQFDVLFLEIGSYPKMIIRKDIKNTNVEFLLENYACYLYENYKKVPFFYDPMKLNKKTEINFILHYKCNRKCEYCNQKNLSNSKVYSDDEMFDRFCMMIDKVESLGKPFTPHILGGEPTLFSDYLIEKIMNRLQNYKQVFVFSNKDKKDSLWEKYNKVIFFTHVVDWYNKKLEYSMRDRYIIVLTHKDVPYLSDFLKLNTDVCIDVNEYQGTDKDFILTDKDKEKAVEEIKKYDNVTTSITKIEKNKDIREFCKSIMYSYEANCNTLRIRPCCCGHHQKDYPIEEFNYQRPSLDLCKDCTMSIMSF